MMNNIKYITVLFCAILCTVSCQNKQNSAKSKGAKSIVSKAHDDEATDTTLDKSLASKGIITSAHDVPVYSMVSEVIKQRYIKEGVRVAKGQVLFTLDQTMQQIEMDKTMREIDQAKFQYDNILVGQGYDPDKPNTIPQKIRNIARTRSSLNLYEQTIRQERLAATYYTIHAPISGVITDLQAYQFDLAEKGKVLCRIIDTDHLNVQFSILENELSIFQKGSIVHFTTIAYPNEVHSATVTHISPKVDENGMVVIKAAVNMKPSQHPLMVGMTTIVKK